MNNTNRIAYWDNLKAVLIFLVVLGHFLYPGKNNSGRSVDAVLYFIYMFHMPAFVFVSGHFSKRYVQRGASDVRKLVGFLVLYVFLYVALWLINVVFERDITMLFIFTTYSAQWYLMCMFLWYLVIPYCAKMRPIPMMALSILSALIVGIDSKAGPFLALSRFFVFLPFFLAGYYFDESLLGRIKPWMKGLAACLLLAALLFAYKYSAIIEPNWSSILCGNKAYSSYKTGIPTRFVWYFASSLLVASMMCLTPKGKTFYTYLGQRTLAIYIIHRIIEGICGQAGLFDHVGSGVRMICICIIISLVVTVASSEKHFTTLFNKAFSAEYKFLVQNE